MKEGRKEGRKEGKRRERRTKEAGLMAVLDIDST
jgi:hypothetical protein